MPVHGEVFHRPVVFVVVPALVGLVRDRAQGDESAEQMQGVDDDQKKDQPVEREAAFPRELCEMIDQQHAEARRLHQQEQDRQQQRAHQRIAEGLLPFTAYTIQCPVNRHARGKDHQR